MECNFMASPTIDSFSVNTLVYESEKSCLYPCFFERTVLKCIEKADKIALVLLYPIKQFLNVWNGILSA
jgi:hypothetical protein